MKTQTTNTECRPTQFWKIGSRWGNCGDRVLDLFLDYGYVFFGSADEGRIGDYESVRAGDIILVKDGYTPVAIAKALPREGDIVFLPYKESGLKLPERIADELGVGDNYIVACRAKVMLLTPEEQERVGQKAGQIRFSKHAPYDPEANKTLLEIWNEKERAVHNGEFNIYCSTCSLTGQALDNGRIHSLFSPQIRYRVPIYQRPYSWGEMELGRLMEELKQAYSNQETVFMGTMQLSQAVPLTNNGSIVAYELIDGQQRFTTFMILWSLLCRESGCDSEFDFERLFRTYVNRGEAQKDLEELWLYLGGKSTTDEQNNRNPYLRNANLLTQMMEEHFGKGEKTVGDGNRYKELIDFLKDKVKFVVIETHAGLSKTLQIFNTINTAGLDLGTEDLFKIRFYEYRKMQGDDDAVFDRISGIYATVQQYNREHNADIDMADVLATYQKILVARHELPERVYNMGHARFFDELFDTALNIHKWPGFDKLQGNDLKVEDLEELVKCYIDRSEQMGKDVKLEIFNAFVWNTRYGYTWDFNIVARFFGAIKAEEMGVFTENLCKLLIPSSLYFAKRVYKTDSALRNLLEKLAKGEARGLSGEFSQESPFGGPDYIEVACKMPIAGNYKWKSLLCRLVEYLSVRTCDKHMFEMLFETPFDIEHIQCYTDENDREAVWNDWGETLDSIGNLVMLEQGLNRSIGNNASAKPEAYKGSEYASVKALAEQVAAWDMGKAICRGQKIANDLCAYLFHPETHS